MADKMTPEQRHRCMASIKSRKAKIERNRERDLDRRINLCGRKWQRISKEITIFVTRN